MKENKLKEVQKYIPQLKQEKYATWFKDSIEKGKENYTKDNPLHKLQGKYQVELPRGETLAKIKKIQDNVVGILQDEYPDTIMFMKPTDKGALYVFEDGRESKKKIGRFLKDKPEVFRQVNWELSQYPKEVGDNIKATIHVSNDPVDIIRKSSSRSWSDESCERIGGQWEQGSFSDIENNNGIAYVYFGENTEPAGRYMVRWCENDKGKKDVGVEPIMYPHGQGFAFTFLEKLSDIFLSKGYGKYSKCVTPYRYEGYSDQLGGSGKIKYFALGKSNLKHYASDPDISRNTAMSFLNADDATRRTMAENSGLCKHDEVVNKLVERESDVTTLNHLFDNCSPSVSLGSANRLLRIDDTGVRGYLARHLKE